MKTILRDAAHELERRRYQGPIDQLLKPLEKLAEDPASHAGGSDSVIFVSPEIFRHLRLLAPTQERLIVASHPHITSVLAQLMTQREFYVLAITKRLLRLGRWYDGHCVEVPLPAGVPKSFEESLVFDRPDHDLQSRSPAGGAYSAQVGPTRFGTSSERDLVHERLHHYLQMVDRELTGFLKGAPLVLVGIAQELAAYRSVSEYPRVLSAKPTSPSHLTMASEHGCRVVSYNISAEQVTYGREWCRGLPVRLEQKDYREAAREAENFDRVVSIGLCEHIGLKNYPAFLELAQRKLKPGGLFLVHTIGGNASYTCTDAWMDKYIFPNGMIPSVAQLGKAMEGRWVVEDWHNFGPDYDRMLMAWWQNFDRAWPALQHKYGERFYRMWKYYLMGCAGGFRARKLQLWQIVLSKGDIPAYTSVR